MIKSNCLAEVKLVYKTKVKLSDKPKITNSNMAYNVLQSLWDKDTIEHSESVVILLMNNSSRLLGWAKIFVGGINACYYDAKIILQLCITANASGFILAHNHPSGNLEPSKSDIATTEKLKDSAKAVGIQFLDHVIITSEGYYSFEDEGGRYAV